MKSLFSNVAKLFWLYFCVPKTKSTSQALVKPKIFVNFSPEAGTNPNSTRPEKPGPTYNSDSTVITSKVLHIAGAFKKFNEKLNLAIQLRIFQRKLFRLFMHKCLWLLTE